MNRLRRISIIFCFSCPVALWIATSLNMVNPPSMRGNRSDDDVKVVSLFRRYQNNSSTIQTSTKLSDAGTNAPCYKVVYTWLDERDTFHVHLIFKQVGQFMCPGLSCGVQIEFGRNYSRLAASDVVFLFYKSAWDWRELLKHQSDRQKWVFWTSESPRHTDHRVIPLPEYTNTTYDYIMTYRKGATNQDAVLNGGGYGYFDRSKPLVPPNDTTNWAANKTKMVANVATNCHASTLSWDRTGFIKALAKHVSVDFYGPCGTMPCKDLATCGLQKYRFYMALENSECDDYITEKFWYTALTLGLIPIAFGAPKEHYIKVAPPNSYIFVPDFPSISKLAAYLVELSENDELYNKYFEWKKLGFVTYKIQFMNLEPQNLCDNVVSRVLKDEAVERTKNGKRGRQSLVNDWEGWWSNSCHSTCSKFPIPEE